MGFVRKAGLVLGVPVVVIVMVAVILLPLRIAYIESVDPAVDEAHLAAKRAYLEGLPEVEGEAFNIVVIFFDDLGWGDLSSYGNPFIDTPRIDELADEGLLMTNFYSASPVCTPSRAALLTGRFAPRTRTDRHVFFNDYHLVGFTRRLLGLANELPREEITLTEVLQRTGYDTKMVGKWHLGTRVGYRPTDFGFNNWYGVLYSNDMYPFDLYRNDEVVIEDKRDGGFLSAERDEWNPLPGEGVDQTRLTQMYTDEAVRFIQQADETPFFLYVAHSFPHVPHYASAEHAGDSDGGTYGDVVEDLDRSTGAIVQALEDKGLADNTLVIVTSDNGADYNGSSGPVRGRKQEILEGGQRVPMIVRWTGQVPAGSVSDEMAMNTDLLPTILDLLDLPLPEDRIIDGRSISATLTEDVPVHDYLYYFRNTGSLPGAIRNRDFKLHWAVEDYGRSREHLSRMAGAEAHEVSNLYPEVFSELKQELGRMRDEVQANPRGWR